MNDMPTAPASLESLMASVQPTSMNAQAIPKTIEHTVHEPDEDERELFEQMRLERRASRTSFATGNVAQDVHNLQVILAISKQLTGLLNE